jgi:phage terminase large subunit
MLMAVDKNLREGTIDPTTGKKMALHNWQIEVHEEMCLAEPKPNSLNPYKYALCAANGSGKDAFIVTPFAVWFIVAKVRSIVVLTSSSGVQLSNQTENLIRNYCKKVNEFFLEVYGAEILHIKQRHIECLLSGSVMYFFATDEEGKAEGYHPVDIGCEMAIIVNEAKSVKPEIFRALRRCTGFNYWINVSTPGEPVGDFYLSTQLWKSRKITYYDCPHQSPKEFEEDKIVLGEHSPLFRSKWLAEFTFIGGKYVVNQERLERMRRRAKNGDIPELQQQMPISVGLDIALSSNGDETSVVAMKGNIQLHPTQTWREQDATKLADKIELYWLLVLRIPRNHPHINADDGGVGRAVIDILRKRGWNIRRVLNQSQALNTAQYRNRGAELWYKFARFVEEGIFILQDDEMLYKQLASRKYKEEKGASVEKLTLQNKKEMKAEGLPSPDRADALILAVKDYNIEDFLKELATVNTQTVKRKFNTEERIGQLEQQLWNSEFKENRRQPAKRHSRFSLGALLGRKKELPYAAK